MKLDVLCGFSKLILLGTRDLIFLVYYCVPLFLIGIQHSKTVFFAREHIGSLLHFLFFFSSSVAMSFCYVCDVFYSQGSRMKRQVDVWGSWGEWSKCSRSCGGGVSFRQRRCYSQRWGLTPFLFSFFLFFKCVVLLLSSCSYVPIYIQKKKT